MWFLCGGCYVHIGVVVTCIFCSYGYSIRAYVMYPLLMSLCGDMLWGMGNNVFSIVWCGFYVVVAMSISGLW